MIWPKGSTSICPRGGTLWPGLGRLIFLAIGQRDLPVVQGVSLLIAFFIVLVNFAVDVIYGVVDPRIRAGSEEI